jgi:hypothetical protein
VTSAPGGTTGNKTTLSSSLPTFGPLLGRKGIRPRLLTFLTCALLLPGLATTSLVYFTVRNSLCEAALREDLVLSRRIAEKVSSFLNTAQQALNTLAIEQDGPQKRSAFPLRKFLLKFPFFSEVATYDLEGKGLNHAVRSNNKVVWGPYSYSRMGPKEMNQAKEGRTHGVRFVSPTRTILRK